jgi:ATP-binding cassette subfamily B protein
MNLRAGLSDDDLPSVPRALGRAMKLAFRVQPRLLVISTILVSASGVPDAFGALWLKTLADAVTQRRPSAIAWSAGGLAAAAALGWLMRTVGYRVQLRFRDLATIELEAHVARLQATVASVEHHERPAYLDRLQLLREQVFLLNHIYQALSGQVSSIARVLITVVLLMSLHPALVFLALFAVPSLFISSWRAAVERRALEKASPPLRRSRHLFELGTTAGPGKEVRVSGIARKLFERRRESWEQWYSPTSRARWASSVWHAAGWTLFGVAYVGAVVFIAAGLRRGPGDVLLVLAAGANLSRYLGLTVGQAEFLRWTLDAAQRLVWLEDYAEAKRDVADRRAPSRLAQGIRFADVSFRYPQTEKWVLRNIELELPAGSVVALVGENGAGKTTLVKLLSRMYEPTVGEIAVDGTNLNRIASEEWRSRLSGAFQDYFRFEYEAQHAIGVGDLPRLDERPAAEAAVDRAGAQDVVDRLPNGLDTQLGPTWNGGVELSIGQWQKVALARGFMRDRPLVCILDEPTASLDAETEHSLFERFANEAKAARQDGRVTILVSHRFSTVRMADLIVVLDDSRIVEMGSHDELVARRGLYAELFETQAKAYR